MTSEMNNGDDQYQSKTLRSACLISRYRRRLLPAYPTYRKDERPSLLLLANVHTIDRDIMEIYSYTCSHDTADLKHAPFKMILDPDHEHIDSFIIGIYQQWYKKLSDLWLIEPSIIDYNFVRLQRCMNLHMKQYGESAVCTIDEYPLALEFYLQIDVDLFFMKTCHYLDAKPRFIQMRNGQHRYEGILCRLEPKSRANLKACGRLKCMLCRPESKQQCSIEFADEHSYTFLNGYRTLLNCSANCLTSNVIYSMRCLCGQYEYIGSTPNSFVDRIEEHRVEVHQVIREFLFGSANSSKLFSDNKTRRRLKVPYDEYLYYHSARCRPVLQRFLEKHPIYKCFVPKPKAQVKLDNDQYLVHQRRQQTETKTTDEPTTTTKLVRPCLFAAVVGDLQRTDNETKELFRQIPVPPDDHDFTHEQRQQQWTFFQDRQEKLFYPKDFIDLYRYTIIAVLPETCSRNLRHFIESLFITHTETNLNMIGHLTHPYPNIEFDTLERHRSWCVGLNVQRRTSSNDPTAITTIG